jgi:plasmid stabilization system protein ParE
VKIVWSPLALERVAEEAERIASDRPVAAEAWLNRVFAAVERLSKFPESGRTVPELRRTQIREILHGDYRIVHRVDPDAVVILTVRHARQVTSEQDLG